LSLPDLRTAHAARPYICNDALGRKTAQSATKKTFAEAVFATGRAVPAVRFTLNTAPASIS
jgi:hypothetical protein